MGYRCPLCFKDFGRDKTKWEEHIKQSHDGIGEDIKNLLSKVVKEPLEEDPE